VDAGEGEWGPSPATRRRPPVQPGAASRREWETGTMRRRSTVLILLALVTSAMLLPGTVATARPAPPVFQTSLSPGEEVTATPVESSARGNAVLRLSKDGSELHYRVTVSRIENVTMAHLHLAPAGANGPVVAWLYPSSPPPQLIEGRLNGVLAAGTITESDLVGLLGGATLADLVDQIEAGNVYVNVHTSAYPAGEIRGQL
jgi:hypothetical protein